MFYINAYIVHMFHLFEHNYSLTIVHTFSSICIDDTTINNEDSPTIITTAKLNWLDPDSFIENMQCDVIIGSGTLAHSFIQ